MTHALPATLKAMAPCPQPRTGRRAFTLIELLVVIAIIALLAAILFPVFELAREKARSASCQSNLKQIGLGLTQYEQDFDEELPLGEIYPFGPIAVACAGAQLSTGPQFATNWGPQPMWMGYIYPYTKSTQIYYCPDGPTSSDAIQFNYVGGSLQRLFGYAYNAQILRNTTWQAGINSSDTLDTSCNPLPTYTIPSTPIVKIADPASVIMIGDRGEEDRAAFGGGNSPHPNVLGGADPLNPTNNGGYGCNPSQRHSMGANFCYADGHVKWMSVSAYLAQEPGILNYGVS